MIYFWGVIGGIIAVSIEALFTLRLPYVKLLPFVIPAAVAINYTVYRIILASPSLVSAFIVFGFTTATLRVIASLAMSQKIGIGTWFGLGLMLMANVTRHWKP